jgi:hypothetical protein
MTNEKSKAVKILVELIGFFILNDIEQIDMNLSFKDKGFTVSLKGSCDCVPDELKKLNETINAPRQNELEEYYWGLLGSSNTKQELYLLGSLVDSGEVEFIDGILKVTVERTH